MQKKENHADVLIAAYRQAISDAEGLTQYISQVRSADDIEEASLPVLVKDLQRKNTEAAKLYIACSAVVGGNVATAVGTTLAYGALTSGASFAGSAAALAASYGASAAVGSMIPGVNLLLVPALSLPLVLKYLQDRRVKKYRKDNLPVLTEKKEKISRARAKVQRYIKAIQKELQTINDDLKKELQAKIRSYQRKAKALAKEIAIEIDDLVNAGANERILRYNEIILKQYRLQKELEDKLDYLYGEYAKLLQEKECLEKKVETLIQLLNAMNCPEAVINQALAECEGGL